MLPERPLRQWVLSLPHAQRYLLATDPDALTLVLGVVYRTISGHLLTQAGLTRATGATGAVTLVQRFGSALNLSVHFHMIFPDGAYLTDGADPPVFRHVDEPGAKALQELVERDSENACLSADASGSGPLDDLLCHSITCRIAVGPRAGQKQFTLHSARSSSSKAWSGSNSPQIRQAKHSKRRRHDTWR